jgi:hypothetical protein
MGQNVDPKKDKTLFSRRVEFDLSEKISEIHELRERVRLAEIASKQLRSERPDMSRNK